MSDESKSDVDRIAEAISGLSFNTGKTNREVRNKLEATAEELSSLRYEIADSRQELSKGMAALAESIDRHSASSSSLTKVIIFLTVILAISAVVAAVTPLLGSSEKQDTVPASVGVLP